MSDRLQKRRKSASIDSSPQAAGLFNSVQRKAMPESAIDPFIVKPPHGFDFRNVSVQRPPEQGDLSDRSSPSSIQPKLTVSQPDDPYEQEADRVADKVMRMQDPRALEQGLVMRSLREAIQHKCTACEEEDEVQAQLVNSTIRRKPIAMRSFDKTLHTNSTVESRLSSSKGGGSPLPEVRSFMEPKFGTDFSQARIHTDSEAVQMNQDLNAQAFTHKQDVYFGVGKAPGKDALTAHELTHVVQQTSIDKAAVSRLPDTDIQLDETPLQKVTRLDKEIAQGIKEGDFEMAAKALNQYSVEDIQKTLKSFQGKGIKPAQQRGIHQGAISAGLGPHSNAAKETSLVPGLPKERVADVESKWLSDDRSATVRESAFVLAEAGKIDLTKMGGDTSNIRGIAYDENASSNTNTVKSYGITAGSGPPIVNIYPAAFEKDLPWLFATILHEYQHVLQFTSSPESIIPGTEGGKSNQQEVEAWASMLINAEETGIVKSPTDIRECWQGLTHYWNLLGPESKAPLQELYNRAKSVAKKVLGSSAVR